MKLRNMKLSMKLGLVFAILFLMNAASFALASVFVSNMQTDAAKINMSGIQRMNMERIYRLAQAPPNTPLEQPEKLLQTIQHFEENLQKLQYGTDPKKTHLEKIGPIWVNMHALLVELRSVELLEGRQDILASIEPLYDILSVEINNYVTLIQEESAAKVKRLKKVEFLILIVNLLFVALGLWAIVSKIMGPLGQLIGKMNSLAEGQYGVEALPVNRSDEIGQLSKSFNSMLLNLLIRKDVIATGHVQRKLLPPDFENEWLRIFTIYEPQQLVSGDFIDFVWDEQRKRLYGFVIDIMGHGMAAALQASAMRVLLHQEYEDESLDDKLTRINNEAIQYFDGDTFAAVICFELNLESSRMTIASGGINHVLLSELENQTVLKIPGGYIGMFENTTYEQINVSVNMGTGMIFATDGLLDVMPKKSEGSGNFEQYVSFLKQLAAQTTKRDDASAICVFIKKPMNNE